LRQRVIDILELLELPTPRHLLQDMLACGGISVDLADLARLRRAEERAFQANTMAGGRWLVPAISSLDLSAIAATFTCSTWPLEHRVVGAYTPRARMLRVLLRLLDSRIELDAERSGRLIARLAETVPGAMEHGRLQDAGKLRSAAQAELEVIEPLDLQERHAAAQRLAQLSSRFQLWGQPVVLTTSPTPHAPEV
jgi:hypothetical protein